MMEIVLNNFEPDSSKILLHLLQIFFTSSSKSRTTKDQGRTFLNIEWTNQHGCGGDEDTDPHKVNCNLVIQYLCQPEKNFPKNHKQKLRNGKSTATPTFQGGSKNEKQSSTMARMNRNLNVNNVLQEQWMWYEKCNVRSRNKGNNWLFLHWFFLENELHQSLRMQVDEFSVGIEIGISKAQLKVHKDFRGP